MSKVVTRFAPSPTGLMHLGNVRTAMLNWMFAKKMGGKFLLRFEDTDQSRSEQQYIDALKEDMLWLGLQWDDQPLFQSKHAEQHQEALDKLAVENHAYPCFCSESQLNLDRKLATSRGLPPRYNGRCRVLSAEDRQTKLDAGEDHTWRLAVHADSGEVTVPDLLRNNVVFLRKDLDDPVVVRSDGTFTFLLPNAIDDAVDGISHVLRGDDHLTNSAYQVWMLESLGYTAPVCLHHGLLLGEDGAKLSKRTGSHSVADLRAAGLFPEALQQAMIRLGHPNISDDAVSLDDLTQHTDIEHLSTSSVRWSNDEMWRWHTKILHTKSAAELAPLLNNTLTTAGIALDKAQVLSLAETVGGNLNRIEDVLQFKRLFDENTTFSDEDMSILKDAGKAFFDAALSTSQAGDCTDWKAWTNALKKVSGAKGKALFMPLRIALTGQKHGPEMSKVVVFLGEAGVKARLQQVLGLI
ncbi:MAG TPA: glutamate--tRNA ligase [Ghiorsea sp.]|nr:glutamate--tRNA ligase [Ghiorsea sp.]